MPTNISINLVQVSTSVSKLGPTIPTVNLPPIITCRKDAPCAKCAKDGGGCYAMKGHWLFTTVKERLAKNLAAYKENPKLYFDMVAQIFDNYKYARFHSSGDIVDYNYLVGMCKVARKCKETQILVFTKKYELVNQYVKDGHRIPNNLHIVFSGWDNFVPENPYNFPTTHVYFPSKPERNKNIPENAIPCSGSCATCHACWTLKKGQSVKFKKH